MTIPSFSEAELEQLSKILGDAASGTELTRLFHEAAIADPLGEGATKWRRIAQALSDRQRSDRCGNNAAAFLKIIMRPVRFLRNHDHFQNLRAELNQTLSFKGLELLQTGELKLAVVATTISEAEERAGRLRAELTRRRVHPDVLSFCRSELLKENYFHAILEASKSVAQKLREVTGSSLDGSKLVDAVLSLTNPLLVWNSLQTDSERSEQTGFGNLLKGIFGMFRNPTAHDPSIRRNYSEEEAMDLLTLVSFCHRRIDAAHRTANQP